jgi:single-strand DNA-binding protein
MSYGLKNRVQLIGNIGASPESKTTENGKTLVRFSVATNESYRNAEGEKVVDTQWHTLVAWGKLAEIAEKYLDKGAHVAIEGKLVHRTYIDKDEVKRFVTEIQCTELLLLGTKSPE